LAAPLARGAALVPGGTAALGYAGTTLQAAGAAGAGWFAGTAINEAAQGNAYEATAALTDAASIGLGIFGSVSRSVLPRATGTVRVVVAHPNGLVTVNSQAVTATGEIAGEFGAIFDPATGILKAGLMEVQPAFRGAGVGGMLFDDVLQGAGSGVRQIDSLMAMTNRTAYMRAISRWFPRLNHEQAMMQMPAARIRASRGWTDLDFDPNTSVLRARRSTP